MKLQRDHGLHRLIGLMLVLVWLPACSMPSFLEVARPKDGVSVRSFTADIAYATDAPAPPPQPLGALSELITMAPDTGSFNFDFDETLPELDRVSDPIPFVECPDATDTSFPEKPVTAMVTGRPTPGVYRWKHDGWIEVIGITPKLPAAQLGTRTVRAVTPTPDGFTYEYEQTSVGGNEIQTIGIRYAENAPTNGVYLLRLQLVDNRGQSVLDFNPPSLLAPKLMSLPVVSERIAVTSVDPVSKLSFTLEGEVDGRAGARLDACGEMVEAWRFTGSSRLVQDLTDQAKAMRSTKYDTYFASQLGGLFVGDHVETIGTFEGVFNYRTSMATNIGTLKPEPEKR